MGLLLSNLPSLTLFAGTTSDTLIHRFRSRSNGLSSELAPRTISLEYLEQKAGLLVAGP